MKRFFIGMLILGGIIAAAAVIMKRRSGSDVSWDEFARDTSARMSDAASLISREQDVRVAAQTFARVAEALCR